MIKTTYQTPELRNANDEIIQQGAFGKNTALSNSTNDGWIDYVMNDLEAIHDTIGDSAAHLDGNGHVVEPCNLAIGDEDGNRLKTSYLKLTGGTVAGTLNVRQNLKIQDNQENVFGGVYVPSSSSTEQYAQFYGGESVSVAGAKLTLYPDGDGRFKLDARSTDGSNTYTLVTDNNGNLNWRGYPLAWKKDYLPLSGGTMTGSIYEKALINFQQMGLSSKGTNPSGWVEQSIRWSDATGNISSEHLLGMVRNEVGNTGNVVTRLIAYKNVAGSADNAQIAVYYPPSGDPYTSAPTPVTSDNSTKIATTAYVKSNLNSYLPLSGGTMTGSVDFGENRASFSKYGYESAISIVGGSTDSGIGILSKRGSFNNTFLILSSGDQSTNPRFRLLAGDGTTSKELVGKPDGTLTWGGNAIWTSNTTPAVTPNLNADNVLGTSVLTYQQVGKLVYVNINALRMSASATTTYNGMEVATGLPIPAFTQRFSPLQVSDESAQPVPSINTSGTLYVATRGTSIANKILAGGFVYIAR